MKINTSLNEQNFAPFIPDAQRKYIRPFLGAELFDKVVEWSKEKPEETPEDEKLKALYPYVVAALSRFTFFLAAPHLNLHIGESGFGVVESSNIAPASENRVNKFMASLEQLAWDNMEEMIRFLEEKKDDYPLWVSSSAFTLETKNLINSATLFNKFVDIDQSRLTFHRLRQTLTNVEQMYVKPMISEAQFDVFVEKIRDNEPFDEIEKAALTHLQAFVANKAAHLALQRETLDVAQFHLVEARDLMNRNPDEFPKFKDSDKYLGNTKPYKPYENTDDSGIFSAVI